MISLRITSLYESSIHADVTESDEAHVNLDFPEAVSAKVETLSVGAH